MNEQRLSCLEAILLLSIFLNTNHEQGISEDEISLDPSAPNCCLNTLSVIREVCDHNNDSLSENYTESHIKNMIHYAMLRLKNMKLVNLKLLKGKRIYTANVDFDLLQELIKEKSANCPRMKSYFDSIINSMINSAESKMWEPVDDSQPADTTNMERSLIRKNVAASISAAEKKKLFKYFQNVNTVCLKWNEKSYRFLPVFATFYQKELYFVLNPLFANEFGDAAALVFKRFEDKTLGIVTDSQTTEKIFEFYYLAKESTNEKQ